MNSPCLASKLVPIQLNNLPLRKALEMQQQIQNLLSQARLDNLNYTSPSLNCSTPIPSIDRSTLISRNDNFVSNPRDLQINEHKDKSFHANDENRTDDCDNDNKNHRTQKRA